MEKIALETKNTLQISNLVTNLMNTLFKRYDNASETFCQDQSYNRFRSSEVKDAFLSLQLRVFFFEKYTKLSL